MKNSRRAHGYLRSDVEGIRRHKGDMDANFLQTEIAHDDERETVRRRAHATNLELLENFVFLRQQRFAEDVLVLFWILQQRRN